MENIDKHEGRIDMTITANRTYTVKEWFADKVDAISPEALEDWAMMVSYENAQR